MKGWCKAAADLYPFPSQLNIEQITAEWVALYQYVLPPGENIPVSIAPFHIYESVLDEEEIDWAVRGLRSNFYGGPSRTIEQHLQKWQWKARKMEAAEDMEMEVEAITETEM